MAATDFQYNREPVTGADISYKNTSGSAIVAGMSLKLDTGNLVSGTQANYGMTPTVAVTDMPDGVAVQNTPANAQGTVQILGLAVCIATGAVSAGATVGPTATAGEIAAFTSTDPSLGKAWTAAASAGDPIMVRIHCDPNNH